MLEDFQAQEIKMEDLIDVSLTGEAAVSTTIRYRSDPAFHRAWHRNFSELFYKDLWERLDDSVKVPRNKTFRIYGTQGGGKSRMSLFLVEIEKEFFGFNYVNLFSKMNAATWMVDAAYVANKTGGSVTRCTMNIDEDRKIYGSGSAQDENFFEGFIEFLRQNQINVHICNPYDIRDIDVQLEVIGYTKDNYSKSIYYKKIDPRSDAYYPLGYVVGRLPSKNYDDAYALQKKDFLRTYVGNLSGTAVKDDTILRHVWEDMSLRTKELIRKSVLLNHERDMKHLIKYGQKQGEGLRIFNLPTKYADSLIDAFVWKYYAKEKEQVYDRQAESIEAKANKFLKHSKAIEQAKGIKPLPEILKD